MRHSLFCLSVLAVPTAHAQTARAPQPPANGDVVRAADDAFGRRVGIEEVGLYSEGEVRGFDLQAAGNYRIEDHYYVRVAGMLQPLNGGTAIRVGANGLRTDFAAPSGVVQYTLPAAGGGSRASLEAGWWGGSGPVAMLRGAAGTAGGELSVAGGLQLSVAQQYSDGTGGDFVAAGLVPRWSPAPGVRVTGLWSHNWFPREGDTFFANPAGAPDQVKRWTNRTQSWMRGYNESDLLGAFADVDAGNGWTFGASLFRNALPYTRSVFNLLRFTGNGREAAQSGLVFGAENRRSISGELTAARQFRTGNLTHRIIAMARRRDSMVESDPGVSYTLGTYADVNDIPEVAAPAVSRGAARMRDDVGQWTGGLGYRLSIGSFAELRLDAQRVDYAKRVRAVDGRVTEQVTRPWLYGGSLSVAISDRLTGFASYARGLEEAGVAPANASNRGAVLPAAISRQAELGVKYGFAGGPTLIAGLFDLSKPTPGIDAAGAFDFVGKVRHRGVELSLAGPLTSRLSAVLGATYLDAKIEGELVDRGVIGTRPIGRPEVTALANLTWRVPGMEGLTVDGGLNVRGARYADRENRVELPSYATFNLGVRQAFELDGHPVTLRARVTNLTDKFAWNPTNSGLITPIVPRTLTLTLTGEI
ncbi:iron complex outermembrane receptor protein [Sphingomonas kyeonggiensis]|uniref:Iron complex outermembrane receptor protein n=1 Tax=Sphingomonas kyeonggiensis TaxID=1268553 RepID=A0A7W7K289_9SPHN|nr:TonB-dependent receptor [Sphingomonas kyeonggiensis]MBB4839649.1 iron complex outermembrane receptor protein [Sphingomonas kyeonggiensis]